MQVGDSYGGSDPVASRFLPAFRRSRLTEILAHALAGNSKTFVVSSLMAVPDRVSNRREARRLKDLDKDGDRYGSKGKVDGFGSRSLSVSRSRSASKESRGSLGSAGSRSSFGSKQDQERVLTRRFYHISKQDQERVLDVTRYLRMCATRPR